MRFKKEDGVEYPAEYVVKRLYTNKSKTESVTIRSFGIVVKSMWFHSKHVGSNP